MRRSLIAGNWKLNGRLADLAWLDQLSAEFKTAAPACDVAVCPPALLLAEMSQNRPDWLSIGAQDCSAHASGAHTGEISADMLAETGCRYVIVGHSERRADHGETSQTVKIKAERVLNAGLTPIICLGESLTVREAGQAETFCVQQLLQSIPEAPAEALIVAYEPIWAIGTGRTARADDAQSIHQALRAAYPNDDRNSLRILYGGSVKPENAASLLSQADVDGALVGGASLNALSFAGILRSAQ